MIRRLFAVSIGVLMATACSAPVSYYQCDTLTGTPRVDAHTIWDCNREIMNRVVHQKMFSLREFRSAAEFFSGLTGIPADTRETRQGIQPGAGIEQDLARWDAWYRENGDSLVLDPESGRIRVIDR